VLPVRPDLECSFKHVEGLVVALGVRRHAERGRHPMLEEKQRIVCVLRLGSEAERVPQECERTAAVLRKVLDVLHRWHLGFPAGLVARCRHRARFLLSAALVWCFGPVFRTRFALEDPTLLSPTFNRSFPVDQYMVKYFYHIVKGFY
jgi:hypothetical protein